MRRYRLIALALLAIGASAAGCTTEGTGSDSAATYDELDPPEDCDCVPVEDVEIGTVGLVHDVGGLEVTFTRWIEKPGSPGEFVGFEANTAGGSAAFYVNAGGAKFVGSGEGWVHPAGADSDQAFGIVTLEVCDSHPPESEPEPEPEPEPVIL